MFFFNQEPDVVCYLEHYVGNTLVSKQQVPWQPMFLQQIFMGAVYDIMQQSEPRKVRLVRPDPIWDQFEQKTRWLENYLEFKNWKDDDDGVS